MYPVAQVTPASSTVWKVLLRLAAASVAAALLVTAAGWAFARTRFGADDAAAVARIEAELVARFETSVATLGALAEEVMESRDLVRAARRDPSAASELFLTVGRALPPDSAGTTGITVYSTGLVPLAWAGRVTDLPRARVDGPASLFVAPGALGPRLVRVEPLAEAEGPGGRIGSVVVEQLLAQGPAAPGLADSFVLSTSIVPVVLRARLEEAASDSPYSIAVRASDGRLLVEAQVTPERLAAARRLWERRTVAAALAAFGLTWLLAAAPIADLRRRTREPRVFAAATLGVVAVVLGVRLILWAAMRSLGEAPPGGTPTDLLVTAILLAALVWLGIDTVERVRLARPSRVAAGDGATLPVALLHLGAGALGAGWLAAYLAVLQRIVSGAAFDVLQFSLGPVEPGRFAVAFALVVMHAAVVWGAALFLRVAMVAGRRSRTLSHLAAAIGGWIGGVVIGVAIARWWLGDLPLGPLGLGLLAAATCAAAMSRPRGAARRASQAARLAALFLALLVPALAMYPAVHAFAVDAKEQLVAADYGPQAANLRDDLQDRLRRALEAIDAMPSLAAFVPAVPDGAAPTADQAFQIWSSTDLATFRVTSAVELYGPDGGLVSRFALNLPEYAAPTHRAVSCQDWDLLEEVSPFGSSERHVLRASRAICTRGRQVGSIVVRAMLDYRSLPFISARSPYLESLTPGEPVEGAPGRDLEFVVYGWSRSPIFVLGTSVWPLPDPIFDRMVDSRDPLWATLQRDDELFRVRFTNDRGGIYALGYPVITPFGHLVNLAELVVLTGVAYVLLLVGVTLFSTVSARAPGSGRALLREIRSSFYRKLFLAFVAAAVFPVVILAVATRTYFATQFRDEIEEGALQTATVAQRLVEDYATLQRRNGEAFDFLDDQIMVLVGRAIDQAVNLFEGHRLQATSERDLFASQLLTVRTPADVYRSIVLERMPTFVGEEEVGGLRYLVAAAPVRAGGREGIVTVPQTLRRQEIEQQIDELDRRVLFAAVLFVLVGAGLGYWMAERIADPVNRLTRATRRIARGDLDARVAATSSDELRRLVEDFNRMAADLKRQRTELERTQRLEAWADMARQVAHDIKNPLTPIQLSAEHAKRINLDRGSPLSPVLDDCVTSILTQVKLLRQISAEFSSFASAPTPRPEETDMPLLLAEVVEPYRAGLAGRVEIEVTATTGLPIVRIDRTLFARALTNVIENALHAMPGGGRLTITAHADEAAPRSLVVQIADTGVGMDAEAVAKVFQPYFSTKATGTGLGLTIAKRNVELIGGSISVESERGRGTVVQMKLPIEI